MLGLSLTPPVQNRSVFNVDMLVMRGLVCSLSSTDSPSHSPLLDMKEA